jgi:hypothetical protein
MTVGEPSSSVKVTFSESKVDIVESPSGIAKRLKSSRFSRMTDRRFTEHTQVTGIYLRKPTLAALTTTSTAMSIVFAHWGWWWRENDPPSRNTCGKTTATGFLHRCQRRCRDNSDTGTGAGS